jgi:putative oxidoreductase
MQGLERLKPLALLLLRLALGVVFIYHGYPKLFGSVQQAMQGFQRMGFPAYFVYVAGVLEFFGGILLVIGLFTRIAGLLLAVEMVIAVGRVHLPQGPITQVKNYEFPMVLAAGALVLAAVGAGLISLDHAIYREGGRSARKFKE